MFISHIHENEGWLKRLKDYFISLFGEEINVFISGDPETIPFTQHWFERIKTG